MEVVDLREHHFGRCGHLRAAFDMECCWSRGDESQKRGDHHHQTDQNLLHHLLVPPRANLRWLRHAGKRSLLAAIMCHFRRVNEACTA
jgi:hypothetical protein